MNMQQVVFPIPAGGHATLVFPQPILVTLEAITELEQASTVMFESLRRAALQDESVKAGLREYDSWTVGA